MTAALYTPSTVTRIKELARTRGPQAIARELEWSPSRLQEVARRHGIGLAGGFAEDATPTPVIPVIPKQPVPKGLVIETPRARRLCAIGALAWDSDAGVLSTGSSVLVLAGNPGRMFERLWTRMAAGDGPVRGNEIARGISAGYAAALRCILNRKIAPFGLVITSAKAPGGGYQLRCMAAAETSPASAHTDSNASPAPADQGVGARYPRNSQGGT